MVSKPYFNEPGYEASAGTPAGEERSRDYNENIRLHTMRHAMRDVLRRPPYGMESVVRKHFLLTRPLLERQLARWLDECKDGSRKKGAWRGRMSRSWTCLERRRRRRRRRKEREVEQRRWRSRRDDFEERAVV